MSQNVWDNSYENILKTSSKIIETLKHGINNYTSLALPTQLVFSYTSIQLTVFNVNTCAIYLFIY